VVFVKHLDIMKANKILLFLLLISITLILLYINFFENKQEINQVIINNITIKIEIADSPKEHAEGLMYRASLDKNSGMLFIFEDEKIRSFWMKNTLIPLDIIFLDKDLKIINIVENALPCQEDQCDTYESSLPAQLVLELNAGFVEENHINVRDNVTI